VLLQAEQVAREIVATRLDLVLMDVELVQLATGPVLVFSIQNPREPSPEGVALFEQMIRERLADPRVRVVVRAVDSADITAKGRILYGAAHFADLAPEELEERDRVEEAVTQEIEGIPGLIVTAADAVRTQAGWSVRLDVVGPRVLAPAEVARAEERARISLGKSVEIAAHTHTDLFVTDKGYSAVGSRRPPYQPAPPPAPPPADGASQ
jgi:hypothetical protein